MLCRRCSAYESGRDRSSPPTRVRAQCSAAAGEPTSSPARPHALHYTVAAAATAALRRSVGARARAQEGWGRCLRPRLTIGQGRRGRRRLERHAGTWRPKSPGRTAKDCRAGCRREGGQGRTPQRLSKPGEGRGVSAGRSAVTKIEGSAARPMPRRRTKEADKVQDLLHWILPEGGEVGVRLDAVLRVRCSAGELRAPFRAPFPHRPRRTTRKKP